MSEEKCVKCFQVARSPIKCVTCGYPVCVECFSRHLNVVKECPLSCGSRAWKHAPAEDDDGGEGVGYWMAMLDVYCPEFSFTYNDAFGKDPRAAEIMRHVYKYCCSDPSVRVANICSVLEKELNMTTTWCIQLDCLEAVKPPTFSVNGFAFVLDSGSGLGVDLGFTKLSAAEPDLDPVISPFSVNPVEEEEELLLDF